MNRTIGHLIFLVLFFLLGATALGQDNAQIDAIKAQMESDGQKMAQALNLTSEQKAPYQTATQKGAQERIAILEQVGIGTGKKLGMRDKLSMRDAMNKVSAETNTEVAKILDADQMAIYTKMQKQFSPAIKKLILGG